MKQPDNSYLSHRRFWSHRLWICKGQGKCKSCYLFS